MIKNNILSDNLFNSLGQIFKPCQDQWQYPDYPTLKDSKQTKATQPRERSQSSKDKKKKERKFVPDKNTPQTA